MTRATLRARFLLLALLAGCTESHGLLVDSGPAFDAYDPCRLGALWRCGAACPSHECDMANREICNTGQACYPLVNQCNRLTGPDTPGIGLDARFCDLGMTCYVLDHPSSSEVPRCAPPEVCLLSPPDGPGHSCYWSDGSQVTTVPPREECPQYTATPDGMCGNDHCAQGIWGRCPGTDAAVGVCVGLSDSRGFGMCNVWTGLCAGDETADHVAAIESAVGQRVACLRTLPPPPTVSSAFGWWVPRDACDQYAAHFLGQVECIHP